MRIHVVDSENTTGTVQLNVAGGTGGTMNTNATFTSKWVGSASKKGVVSCCGMPLNSIIAASASRMSRTAPG
jgi:hypothetical protein